MRIFFPTGSLGRGVPPCPREEVPPEETQQTLPLRNRRSKGQAGLGREGWHLFSKRLFIIVGIALFGPVVNEMRGPLRQGEKTMSVEESFSREWQS